MATEDTKTVILDTDPGIDDAMALLYLSALRSVRLHAITTVFGNGSVEMTTRNAAYLVERFGLDLPIYAGAAAPLVGARHIPELKVHGEDGLGDTGLASDFPLPCMNAPAWEHMAETITANPGKISLLALGPLTNLALALRNRPEIAALTREVVVMGGAFGTHGRHGNIRPTAEANFFYDPQAADEVLAASWPVTVVGLDVSSSCILSSSQARALTVDGGDPGAFLWQISRGYERIYRIFDGADGAAIHDVAAAACLASPDLFDTRTGPLTVQTGGRSPGRSYMAKTGTRPLHRYCVDVDAEKLVGAFVSAIERLAQDGRAPEPRDKMR
ncbi:nucleoside hydrolase [Sphingopyxis sp. DBS4]|uniref:nucleoside hydrolase n=1 Tax=Sphingopyxis sp. DBS4 TaxID=2968500 RepID=UPI00214C8DCC|nr:nucleoside hydrolase [Sphingopyxis sp. DBS4]